eukprot:Colp12_sorted_trinity150504_noHs@10157
MRPWPLRLPRRAMRRVPLTSNSFSSRLSNGAATTDWLPDTLSLLKGGSLSAYLPCTHKILLPVHFRARRDGYQRSLCGAQVPYLHCLVVTPTHNKIWVLGH